MRTTALTYLVCPTCRGDLELADAAQAIDEDILHGDLRCSSCEATYPIRGGVPRLIPGQVSEPSWKTAKAFGWQWKRFTALLPFDEQREQFLGWVAPLTEADFKGKVVLDAGCGMGRLSEVAASFGAEAVIAADLSESVDSAYERLRERENVHVVQADIYNLPLRQDEDATLDLAYSVGVLHHLPDPRRGFESVLSHVRRGGRFQGWVYGKEGNAWVETLVTPLRERLTSRLPRPALLALSYGLTVPLHSASRAAKRLPLPYGDYLRWLGRYPFHHNLQVVFDHLGPPIAFYLHHDELQEWFASVPVRVESITPRNANSWRFLLERT